MSRLLPNFIQGYLAYTSETEAQEHLHLWTAIGAIAGALRRQVWVDMEYFQVYPNNYIILVGPPGDGKTTAMNVGRKLLQKVPGVRFSVDSTSRERLILDMSVATADGTSAMTGFSSEFGSLLTTSQMDMVMFLIEMYDSGELYEHRTKGGGSNKIKFPCFNMVACTTPDWFATGLPIQSTGVGLLSRTLFVYNSGPRKLVPFPTLSPEQRQLQELLASDLTHISTIQDQMQLSPEAREIYIDWYTTKQYPERPKDNRLTGYFARKRIHAIKTAMVLELAQRDSLEVSPDSMSAAFALLTQLEETLPQVFQSTGKNPLALDQMQVYEAIKSKPEGILFSELLTAFKHNVRESELAEVCQLLQTVKLVKATATPEGYIFKVR